MKPRYPKCVQCFEKMEGQFYYADGVYIPYCERPNCPNYSLLQSGEVENQYDGIFKFRD